MKFACSGRVQYALLQRKSIEKNYENKSSIGQRNAAVEIISTPTTARYRTHSAACQFSTRKFVACLVATQEFIGVMFLVRSDGRADCLNVQPVMIWISWALELTYFSADPVLSGKIPCPMKWPTNDGAFALPNLEKLDPWNSARLRRKQKLRPCRPGDREGLAIEESLLNTWDRYFVH